MSFIKLPLTSFEQLKNEYCLYYPTPLHALSNFVVVPIASYLNNLVSKALSLGGEALSPMSVFSTALSFEEKGKYKTAIYYYSKLLDQSFCPTLSDIFYSQILYQRACCYKKLNLISLALSDSKKADIYSLSLIPEYTLLLSELYILNGQEELAVNLLSNSLNKFNSSCIESFLLSFKPTTFVGCRTLANILISKNKYSRALLYLDQAISLNPNNPYIYETRSIVHNILGNYAQAESDYIQAYFLDKSSLSFN